MNSSTQWFKLIKSQAELIAKCGKPDEFPSALFDTLNSFVRIDSCAVFLINNDNAEHLLTHGKLRKATATKLANNYLKLFRKDPAWQELTGISTQKILWHMRGSSYTPLYKYHFFEKNSLIDKVARVEKSDLGACSCFLYRRKPSSVFSTQDIGMLELIFPFFTSVVVKHCEFLKHQELIDDLDRRLQPQDFHDSVAAVVSHRVAPLDTLTNRELQVCEQIFKGRSIQEIAKSLQVSVNSVATYRQRAYHRLSVCKIQELFALLFLAIDNWRCMIGQDESQQNQQKSTPDKER